MRDQLRLGLWINDINAPIKRAISQAAALGFTSVELSLDHPEIHPDTFSASGRRHLARLVANAGMTIASIASPSGRLELDHADQMVLRASTALQMARDMDVGLATLHADFREKADANSSDALVTNDSSPGLSRLLNALAEVSDRFGVALGLGSGSVDAAVFSDRVQGVGCRTLRIAFDPVDVLLAGGDPIASLEHVSDQLGIAYIRDASPRVGDRGGHACELGFGGLELDRYLAGASQCVPYERMILRGPHERRRVGDIESDITRLSRTHSLRGRE